MSVQVLVAAMNRKNHDILEEMNISSDAIVVNQCDMDKIERFEHGGNRILFISLKERGVGLSRNTALMRANADICLFADEDMIYVDGYEELVENEFGRFPKADVIIFRVDSLNKDKPLRKIRKNGRVRRKEAMRYGCVRIAIRREKQQTRNIWFSLLFGGGARFSSGEDTIFLQDCLKRGLKIYRSTMKIADVKQEQSSWFKGYTDKFFFDKGVLLATVMPKFSKIYAFGMAIKYSKKEIENFTFLSIFGCMLSGINSRK